MGGDTYLRCSVHGNFQRHINATQRNATTLRTGMLCMHRYGEITKTEEYGIPKLIMTTRDIVEDRSDS